MKIPSSWQRTHEFACHEASCAPPPAGVGGSKVTAGGMVKAGWTKYGSGSGAIYTKGDYHIEKSQGLVGGYNAYHVGGTSAEYTSTVGGKKAKSLVQRSSLDDAVGKVSAHMNTTKGNVVKETNVQEGKRRAAESAAKLTPAQRAHVDRLVKSVPDRLKHILVGPPNSKGRQSWKWDSPEAAKRFREQSKKI